MLFGALLTVVFGDIVLNPTKIIQGTCLGPILIKKCFLKRYLIGSVTFLLLFLLVCNYHNRNGKILSSQGKNRTKLACLVQKLWFFISKKHFLAKKNCALLKKTKMYLLITRERIEISQKFQQIWIQQAKKIFLCNPSKIRLHC
jgi:hypothetical protein